MKTRTIITILFLVTQITVSQELPNDIEYISPLPGSKKLAPDVSIILRFRDHIDLQTDELNEVFTLKGSISGAIDGKTALSGYRNTIIFYPEHDFHEKEQIEVTITYPHHPDKSFKYYFYTSDLPKEDKKILARLFSERDPEQIEKSRLKNTKNESMIRLINGVSVPRDFPNISVNINTDRVAPGKIFFGLRGTYILIMENDGTPYYYRRSQDFLMDFKAFPNGLVSKTVDNLSKDEHFFILMDQHFEFVDTITAIYGETTDHHDFQLFPNGNRMIITRDYVTMDMSQHVAGGNPNANVMLHNIQEFDQDGNIVFYWRCLDHIPVTEAYQENLTNRSIDYVHMNSIDVDFDGHIVTSCRNLSSCIKINHYTGEVIWRLGGLNSDFTYLNNDEGNSYQHMFRSLSGKPNYYTLYDNGNYRSETYSRAIEVKLDTINMTAENVWEFNNQKSYFAEWLGGNYRLSNGNTLINWAYDEFPFAQEVTKDGEIVYEAEATGTSYRSYRFEWEGIAKRPYLLYENEGDTLYLLFNTFGDTAVNHYNIYQSFDNKIFTKIATSDVTYYKIAPLINRKTYYIYVTSESESGVESERSDIVEFRSNYYQPQENIIRNPDFEISNLTYWDLNLYNGAIATADVNSSKECEININQTGSENWHVQLQYDHLPLYKGKPYRLEFTSRASTSRDIFVGILDSQNPYTDYSNLGTTYIETRPRRYTYSFDMLHPSDLDAKLVFEVGRNSGTVYIDSIKFYVDEEPVASHSNLPLDINFNIFPNPSNDLLNVSLNDYSGGELQMMICNLTGQKIQSESFFLDNSGHNLKMVDISHLDRGIYFIILNVRNNKDRFTKTLKLIKN